MTPEELKAFEELLKADMDKEEEIDTLLKELVEKGRLDEKGMNAVKGALRLLAPYKSEISPSIFGQLAAMIGYSAPKQKAGHNPPKLKKGDEGYEEPEVKSPFKKEMDAVKAAIIKAAGDNSEAVQKAWAELELEKSEPISDDPKVVKLFKENAEIKKELAIEREARLTKEFQEEASEYKNLSIKKEELGTMLKACSGGVDEKEYKALTKLLKAADKQIGEGILLKELGSDTPGSSDTTEKVETIAKGYMKADAKLTFYEAIAKAWEDNPELYNEYNNEQVAAAQGRG